MRGERIRRAGSVNDTAVANRLGVREQKPQVERPMTLQRVHGKVDAPPRNLVRLTHTSQSASERRC